MGGSLQRRLARQGDDPALGRVVGGRTVTARSLPSSGRGDVDDRTALPEQIGPGEFRGQKDQVEFVADSEAPVLDGEFGDRTEPGRRSVIIEDVDAVMLSGRPGDPSFGPFWIAQITDHRRHDAAGIAHQPSGFRIGLRVYVASDDDGAVGGEPQSRRPTLAAAGAGYQRDPSLQPARHSSIPSSRASCASRASSAARMAACLSRVRG
ncbi:hypothetical protein D3C73_1189900 [compost metagenome]